jgi:tetratricopeptide (TPR) repeat protein
MSLWLANAKTDQITRLKFCALLLCQSASSDSPTSVIPPPDKSLTEARAALLLEPASAYRWADLADSEIDAKNVERGRFCIRQALASAPGNPAILFHAANFYLRLEDYPSTLQDLIAVLRNPDLAPFYNRVFALYSQMDMPLEELLNKGLPHTPQAANGFLRFWIDQNRLEDAQDTWNWINKNSLTSIQSAGSYVALLAKDGRWDDAAQSWQQFSSQVDPTFEKTNWVYNGSFESPIVNCPFDWQLDSSNSIQVDRDSESMYKGAASLRIRYLGVGSSSKPQAYQTVLLKPGNWQIRAAVKTLGSLGNQNIILRVVDANTPATFDTATEQLPSSTQWATVTKSFQVPAATHLAKVEILRSQGSESSSRVTATVWVDDITLAPLP